MLFNVRMTAYQPPRTREVEVPNEELTNTDRDLELVFRYGQNDFQPKNCYSVSVGDVVEFDGKLYMVKAMGHKAITQEEYEEYLAMDERKRWFTAHSD